MWSLQCKQIYYDEGSPQSLCIIFSFSPQFQFLNGFYCFHYLFYSHREFVVQSETLISIFYTQL